MLQVGFPGQQRLRGSLALRMFIRESSSKDRKEAGGRRQEAGGKAEWCTGPTATLVGPTGALELEWLFRVVLTWAEMAEPLHSSIPQSLTIGHLRKVDTLGQKDLYS